MWYSLPSREGVARQRRGGGRAGEFGSEPHADSTVEGDDGAEPGRWVGWMERGLRREPGSRNHRGRVETRSAERVRNPNRGTVGSGCGPP